MTEFDRHAEIYSKRIEKSIGLFGQSHDFFVRSKARILLEILSAMGQPRDMKLLDVGCGTGLVHGYLVDQVAELHGVDVSEESLAVARQTNPGVSVAAYDGDKLPYGNGIFDCAYAICVLHHVPVPQWQGFVSEMARVVKPGGAVVIIEHNPMNPATQWVVRTCDIDDDAILLWPARLRHLFAGARLESVVTRYVQLTPFEGDFFRRLDAWCGKLPLGTQYVVHGRRAR